MDAVLFQRQRATARQIAAVAKDTFDQLVDSDDSPTVTEPAEIGTKHRDGSPPSEFVGAIKLLGTIRRCAEFCIAHTFRKKGTCPVRYGVVTFGHLQDGG